jgi:hypothetical protein
MAAQPRQTRQFRTGRRGPSFIELSLVLSVIAGLGFVTLRIKSMELLSIWTPASTVAANTDAAPVATVSASTKTP